MSRLTDSWCKLYLEYKFKLQEMSMSIRDIKYKIETSRKQLLCHLIKYYIWSDVQNSGNHWKQEIHDALFEMPKIKNRNKYPNEKQLINWGFETTLQTIDDHIQNYIDISLRDENLPIPTNLDINNLQQFLKEYIIWLCKQLSLNNGQVMSLQVDAKINELYSKYHK